MCEATSWQIYEATNDWHICEATISIFVMQRRGWWKGNEWFIASSQLGSFTFCPAQNCIENDQITICIVKMRCLVIMWSKTRYKNVEANFTMMMTKQTVWEWIAMKMIIFKHNWSLFCSSLPLLIIFYSSLAQLIIWEQKDTLFEPLPHRILLLSNIPTVGQKIKRESACKSILLSSIART